MTEEQQKKCVEVLLRWRSLYDNIDEQAMTSLEQQAYNETKELLEEL